MYQKKTLRRMSPNRRRLAEAANEVERGLRKMQKLVDLMEELEQDAERGREDREALHTWAASADEDTRREERLPVANPPCGVCQGEQSHVQWCEDLGRDEPEEQLAAG